MEKTYNDGSPFKINPNSTFGACESLWRMHTLARARGAHSLLRPGCVATFMAGKFSGGRGS